MMNAIFKSFSSGDGVPIPFKDRVDFRLTGSKTIITPCPLTIESGWKAPRTEDHHGHLDIL